MHTVQKKGYLLGVRAIPKHAVPLRGYETSTDTYSKAHQPDQIHCRFEKRKLVQ